MYRPCYKILSRLLLWAVCIPRMGRQEDEPTDEELREFEERFDRAVNFT